MIILSEYHPVLFENYCPRIITICADIMENKLLEQETRNLSTEFVCIIGEMYPALLRRTEEVQTRFYPALFKMMAEVELPEDDEQEEWLTRIEQDDLSKVDVHTVSKINLGRFSKAIGEKVTLAATSELIKEAITHPDWKVRVAGYFFLGFLSESCKESFSQNLDEIMKIAASGVVDSNPRV